MKHASRRRRLSTAQSYRQVADAARTDRAQARSGRAVLLAVWLNFVSGLNQSLRIVILFPGLIRTQSKKQGDYFVFVLSWNILIRKHVYFVFHACASCLAAASICCSVWRSEMSANLEDFFALIPYAKQTAHSLLIYIFHKCELEHLDLPDFVISIGRLQFLPHEQQFRAQLRR